MNTGEVRERHRENSKAVTGRSASDNKISAFRLANVYILSLFVFFLFVCLFLFLEAARLVWRSTGQDSIHLNP